jgi:hypothetical protein
MNGKNGVQYHQSVVLMFNHWLGKFTRLEKKARCLYRQFIYFCSLPWDMVIVAQLVRASDCGSEGRGFESRHSPLIRLNFGSGGFF